MKKNKKSEINSVAVLTLGCSKNMVDSEELLGLLAANDYTITADADHADALVINTCGFIKSAKEESIKLILDAAELRRRKQIKKLIVSGCLTERYSNDLKKQIKNVDGFFGVNQNEDIVKALNHNPKINLINERFLLTPPHFAFMKISEGCDRDCSYCAIPMIRGKHISRPIEDLVAEAKQLAAKGVREINMIAQDSTFYGLDIYGKRKLAELTEQIADVDGIEWVRIHYAYPAGFPEDVLDLMARHPNVCNYMDIPLQHISDDVLKSMRRGVGKQKQYDLIEKFRAKVPELAIRSTFIVGYPNETEENFQELYKFFEDAQLDRVGIFTYSQEDDTHADPLGDPIPEEVKAERRNALMELQQGISLKKNQAKVGKLLKVMIDEITPDYYYGRTEHDAPEVDNGVIISKEVKVKPGDFCMVEITEAEEYDLVGKIKEVL
jgi:ribosomal protein S12 methylthiotransferase